MHDEERRPSPEALLRAAEQESRSQLKIFIGAAPGVGKTYAMLEAAQERRREGTDVVVGIVETHGRPETEALIQTAWRSSPAGPWSTAAPARGDGHRRDPGAGGRGW